MFIYASKYWQEDLKGLISLDGYGIITPPSGTPMTEEEFTAFVAAFKATGKLLDEVDGYEGSVYAGAVPYSVNTVGFEDLYDSVSDLKSRYPWAEDPPVPPETVSDLVAYGAYWAWGEGKVTNYYGGYVALDVLVQLMANFTRYWPEIQNIEGSQIDAYAWGCPYLEYDDNRADVPLIGFFSELFCEGGWCTLPIWSYLTQSEDVTIHYLPGYGHLDVYVGSYSLEDVKEPLLEWLNERL